MSKGQLYFNFLSALYFSTHSLQTIFLASIIALQTEQKNIYIIGNYYMNAIINKISFFLISNFVNTVVIDLILIFL